MSVLTLLVYVGALALAIHAARLATPQVWGLRIVLVVGSTATLLVLLIAPENAVRGAAALWLALVLASTVVLVVRHVLRHQVVTLQTIAGALSAYMLIGLMFAEIYNAMSRLGPAPFFAGAQTADPTTVQYFSFTTLTTLGYGDFTAVGDSGRAVAVLEALIGQVFLATLVARLVSSFVPRGPREVPAGERPEPGTGGTASGRPLIGGNDHDPSPVASPRSGRGPRR